MSGLAIYKSNMRDLNFPALFGQEKLQPTGLYAEESDTKTVNKADISYVMNLNALFVQEKLKPIGFGGFP